jgi:hypothetical protein
MTSKKRGAQAHACKLAAVGCELGATLLLSLMLLLLQVAGAGGVNTKRFNHVQWQSACL